jgi:hypothetical protein
MYASLFRHLYDRGEPLFLSPVRAERIADVRFQNEPARVDFVLVPMGAACHIISNFSDLAKFTRAYEAREGGNPLGFCCFCRVDRVATLAIS